MCGGLWVFMHGAGTALIERCAVARGVAWRALSISTGIDMVTVQTWHTGAGQSLGGLPMGGERHLQQPGGLDFRPGQLVAALVFADHPGAGDA